MNKANKQRQEVHAKLRRQVGRLSRNVRSTTSKAWNQVKQIALEVQKQTNERLSKAKRRQRQINRAKQQQTQNTNPPDFDDMNEMNRFFQSATKSLIQSKEQYESLVEILSQKPKAAEKAAEGGSEEMKALFATLSSMLRRTPTSGSESTETSTGAKDSNSSPT